MDTYSLTLQSENLTVHSRGRLIFDHLPKTGGTAFNIWLEKNIGGNLVKHSLNGGYKILKSRYGPFNTVLSGHLDFDGGGLDPEYLHITCLRDPVERVLSWIFYVLNNHTEDQLGEIYKITTKFVLSDGNEIHPEILPYISNYYVQHFSRMWPIIFTDRQDIVDAALHAISYFDLVGFQTNLDDLQNKVAALLKIEIKTPIERHNLTNNSPSKKNVSAALISKIKEINAYDIAFYEAIQKLIDFRDVATKIILPPHFITPEGKEADGDFFVLLKVLGPNIVVAQQKATFEIEFTLPQKIDSLELGLGIFDSQNLRIFGTNTTLLNKPINEAGPGKYRIAYEFDANLYEGEHFLRISVVKVKNSNRTTIALYDKIKRFTVQAQRTQECIGVANLNASITLKKTP